MTKKVEKNLGCRRLRALFLGQVVLSAVAQPALGDRVDAVLFVVLKDGVGGLCLYEDGGAAPAHLVELGIDDVKVGRGEALREGDEGGALLEAFRGVGDGFHQRFVEAGRIREEDVAVGPVVGAEVRDVRLEEVDRRAVQNIMGNFRPVSRDAVESFLGFRTCG
eukprot:CAMPEP_0118908228 /NCGR_PEP_ID=MMETSP1166-20130328/11335_1 /TAXON_ID=1104430 /ORGANISM="Chrysoreinhardia sp, Strain CCMP3193" /LENGTH=163 /DNA_ID=CAMNT_0006847615 /DNA_START=245 /DNA_END=732 /DNA_ORIENTATION=-